jgi:hypothetical protein
MSHSKISGFVLILSSTKICVHVQGDVGTVNQPSLLGQIRLLPPLCISARFFRWTEVAKCVSSWNGSGLINAAQFLLRMNAGSERTYRQQFTRGWGCHYVFGIIPHNPELQEKSFWKNWALP